MAKESILITRNIGPDAMALLEASPYELVVYPHDSPAPRSWVLENLPGKQGAIIMHADTINDEFLAKADSLRALATFSVGYDHLNLKGLKEKGIRVGYTPGVLTNAVADITVMLTLMTLRRVEEGITIVKSDGWPNMGWAPFMLCGPSLSHPSLTLSFLGFGRISQAVVTRLLAFTDKEHPPTIQYHSSRARDNQAEIDADFSKQFGVTVKRVERDQLAQDADVLVLLCSLNEGTKHFINDDFLGKMKKSAVVINSARGGVVDSDALARALSQGKIFGAGVDVVEGEPHVLSDHPLVKEPRCIVLPHLGSADDDSRKGMARLCAENILGAMSGGKMPEELQF